MRYASGRRGLARYRGSLPATHLKVTGINLFSAGNLTSNSRSESLVFNDAKRGIYKRLIIEDDQVRGAVLYGDTNDGPWYVELMTKGRSSARCAIICSSVEISRSAGVRHLEP